MVMLEPSASIQAWDCSVGTVSLDWIFRRSRITNFSSRKISCNQTAFRIEEHVLLFEVRRSQVRINWEGPAYMSSGTVSILAKTQALCQAKNPPPRLFKIFV